MKTNRENKNKGWGVFFLCVILVLQVFFIKNVYASEVDLVENLELEQEVEEVLDEETEIIIPEEITEEIHEEIIEEEQVEFITKEDIWQFYSTDMDFTKEEVMIQSKINESIMVEDILSNLMIDELKNNYHVINIYIIDVLGNILNDIDILTGGSSLIFIGEDFINSYKIKLLGDYNHDEVINQEDVEEALEENITEENTSTEEVSYIDYVVSNNTYNVEEVITPSQYTLESILEIDNKDIYIEEEITVKYSLEGLKESNVDTISASINYDHNALELVDIYFLDNNLKQGKINDQYFIYLLNELREETPLVIFLFRTKISGVHTISLENIKAVYQGNLLELSNNTSIEFLVQEYGKGGDVELIVPPNIEYTPEQDSQVLVDKVIFPTNSTQDNSFNNVVALEKPVIQATEIYLSNDNYIKDLTIKGYYISFDKDKNNYQIDVATNLDKLTFDIELSNDNAIYFITGNDNLKQGKNNVVLTVQAEDGSTRDYIIEVNKKDKKEDNIGFSEEKIKKVISIIILSILMLSIVWCLYLFIKKEN